MSSDSLTDSLMNLYEWIVEEPEVDLEKQKEPDYEHISIGDVISSIRLSGYMGSTYANKLTDIFFKNNINTVGDLLGVRRSYFSKYRNVGKGSISRIDDALEKLYGIKNW
jgi:DNA-directed RNA polymerase alpha subunit